ncbi:MAG: hypothetical protein GY801_26385 [bacterium]|nr:hypothetical protein [bacterium]
MNRLFSVADTMNIHSLQTLSEQTPLTELDPDVLVTKLLTVKEQSQNVHEYDVAMAQIFEELMQCPEPEMEKFPAHYHEDGIASLRLKLHTQQAVAVQHWQGKTDYTSYNAIQDTLQRSQQP